MQLEAAATFERFTVNYPTAEEVPLALFKLGSAEVQQQAVRRGRRASTSGFSRSFPSPNTSGGAVQPGPGLPQ